MLVPVMEEAFTILQNKNIQIQVLHLKFYLCFIMLHVTCIICHVVSGGGGRENTGSKGNKRKEKTFQN